MADTDEALGQYMEKPAPNEFQGFEWFNLPFFIGAVLVAQKHAALRVVSVQARFMKSRLGHVSREIAQRAFAAPGLLALHDPILGVAG
jgi:hypothetical protein